MTKRDIEEEINIMKFSRAVKCYSKDDKLGDLVKEIYCDGIMDGVRYAIRKLQLLDSVPFGLDSDYLLKNMGKIRETIKLCELYENVE